MNRVRKIIHTDYAYKTGLSGKNVTVAIMDTGIVPHVDFGNRIRYFGDFCEGKTGLYDDNGHGTHVSGIVAGSGEASRKEYGMPVCHGIAPQADIVMLKVLDAKGNGVDCKEPAGISDPPVEYFRWNASKRGRAGTAGTS